MMMIMMMMMMMMMMMVMMIIAVVIFCKSKWLYQYPWDTVYSHVSICFVVWNRSNFTIDFRVSSQVSEYPHIVPKQDSYPDAEFAQDDGWPVVRNAGFSHV